MTSGRADTFGLGFPAGGNVDPRAVLDDTCVSATLPNGVTAPGIGFDSNALCRTLVNVQYDGPQKALQSAQSVQVDFEVLNGFATGNIVIAWVNDTAAKPLQIVWQNDGNLVWYDGGGVLGASGGTQDPIGGRFSVAMGVSPVKSIINGDTPAYQNVYMGYLYISEGFTPLLTQIGLLSMNSSWSGGANPPIIHQGFHGRVPLLTNTPAGTVGHARVATTGTRSIRVHRVRHFIGPIR